jgi:CubicO group peptidase (beta-lactamase class C family)
MKLVIPLAVPLALMACAGSPAKPHAPDAVAIDAEALQLMGREDVQGMAVAIIDDGKIAHVAAY